MGQWGYYDDEGDTVADIWCGFKELKEAPKNPEKIYSAIKNWFDKHKCNNKIDNYYNMSVAGVALTTVRFINYLPITDPLGAGIFDNPSPSALPNGFPEWLRVEALKGVKYLLNDFKSLGEWDNQKERIKSLQHELFLFSNGEEGVKYQ